MSQTQQDPQPLEQTAELKQYHAPELRDYGPLQKLTQVSETFNQLSDSQDGTGTYVTG